MSSLAQRATLLGLIDQACCSGARQHQACSVVGLAARTVQRWVDAAKAAINPGDRRRAGLLHPAGAREIQPVGAWQLVYLGAIVGVADAAGHREAGQRTPCHFAECGIA